ncbi:unnamed protein product [Toxocara canis]|uniref:DET1- and DDB1-associated protein 1 n=1 Tax=Toxocara canis TaxID=6265 RepID=A0A183V365_TOXCA|nr:unnamed protein product [Toxocara canis]
MEDECYLLFTEEMPKDVNRKECQLTAIRSCGPEVKQSYSLPDYLQNHDLQRTHQKRKLDKALSHKNDSNYKAKPTKKGGQASSPKRGDSNVDASCAETVSEDEQLSRFALDWRQVFVVNNSISDEER